MHWLRISVPPRNGEIATKVLFSNLSGCSVHLPSSLNMQAAGGSGLL